MIRQHFKLPDYDWDVWCYYIVARPDADEIVSRLEDMGCNGNDLERAYTNLRSGKLDTGLTYTNTALHQTVVVIAKTSSPKEFAQSWRHELGHVADHIAQCFGISPHGEELQYIGDELVNQTWKIAEKLLMR